MNPDQKFRGRCAWLATAMGLLLASPAQAGCPNRCELTVPPPVVTPPLECGTLTTTANDCNCSIQFQLVNTCATDSITAVDFEFDACWQPSSPVSACSQVLPRYLANSIFSLSTQGETRKTFTLRDAAGDHTVELGATVSDFGEPGCAGCASATHGKPAGVLAVVALAGLALGRRRRRMRA